MKTSVKVYAVLTAKEGRAAELEALLRGMATPSRAEPGNLRYDLWQDSSDSRRFVLDELYQDDSAAAAHKASPHFQNYVSKIGDLAERLPLAVHPIDVA